MVGSSAPYLALGLVAAIGLAACGQIIGVDDYSVADDRDGGSGLDPRGHDVPILPVIPDEGAEAACQRCMEEKCDDELSACHADTACLARLQCTAQCDDPSCFIECSVQHPLTGEYRELFSCMNYRPECEGACEAGRNWDCKREFRWLSGGGENPVRLTVRHAFSAPTAVSYGVLEGVNVSSCGPRLDCHPVGSGRTDAYGHVELSSPRYDWRGRPSFEITGGHFGLEYRYYPPPFVADDASLEIFVQDHRLLRLILPDVAAEEWDPERATLWLKQRDCTDVNAPDIRFELSVEDPDTCDLYLKDGVYDDEWDRTDTGDAVFLNVPVPPDESIVVTGYDAETDDLVSRATIWARPGWITGVMMHPAGVGD